MKDFPLWLKGGVAFAFPLLTTIIAVAPQIGSSGKATFTAIVTVLAAGVGGLAGLMGNTAIKNNIEKNKQ